MSDEPTTCNRLIRRHGDGGELSRCGFNALNEPNVDGERYCWHHADTRAKAEHRAALDRARRVQAAAPDLLAFVADMLPLLRRNEAAGLRAGAYDLAAGVRGQEYGELYERGRALVARAFPDREAQDG